jgi:hypothetical protein
MRCMRSGCDCGHEILIPVRLPMHDVHCAEVHAYQPRLRFMNRLFWNDIHHLLGCPVPSA